jgi:hypothetical protein
VTAPRAVGVRIQYADVPARGRAGVDDSLGSPVESWEEQVGGMSPGCETRVVAADGTRAFVKAVGLELNPGTPTLFRREIDTLERIGDHPLWASLRASYDADGWVALLLDDIPGGHPDLTDDSEMEALLGATEQLGEVLRGVPAPWGPTAATIVEPGLVDVKARFRGWASALDHLDEMPEELVPREVSRDPAAMRRLVARLDEGDTQLSHFDIRIDNLLRPRPGRIVFVDWGGAAVAPAWVDPLLARFERVEDPWFDASVSRSPALVDAGDDRVTGYLVAFGAALAWASLQLPADVGLPTLNEFRRTEARRALVGAARRLA